MIRIILFAHDEAMGSSPIDRLNNYVKTLTRDQIISVTVMDEKRRGWNTLALSYWQPMSQDR